MTDEPKADDAKTMYNDAARVDELIRYLEAEPPYEAVGMVVVAAAELELNLIGLALALGIEPRKAWFRDKRANFLRARSALSKEAMDRIVATVESRDLVAHGVWINLFARGQAFIRPDKQSLGKNLKGRLVTASDFAAWRTELLELNALVESERQRVDPAQN